MTLRKHQQDVVRAGKEMRAGNGKSVLAHVVPGGGKSWLPILLAQQLPPNTKIGWFVPRDNLRQQAALVALEKFNVTLNDCGNQLRPSRETAGFVTTHQSLTAQPDLWRDEFFQHPYLCVIDELHHAWVDRGEDSSPLSRAIGRLPYKYLLSMTGTLERNDSNLIYSIQYARTAAGLEPDGKGSADHFVRYTRENALAENAITPIEFRHFDGPVKWLDGSENTEIECRLSDAKGDDAAAGLFTALNTEYATQLWSACTDHWRGHGQKLLIVCGSQSDAKDYAKRMKGEPGGVYLAIIDNTEAVEHIRQFRLSEGRAVLVTCMMAYEGLDVPAISHICCLTHIRSTPWIYQMLARAWRIETGKARAFCFCPDDPRMNEVIRRIKAEEQRAIRDMTCGGNGSRSNGDHSAILPLSGVVEEIRKSALDGAPISPLQTKFASLIREAGMDLNDPAFRLVWEKLGAEVSVAKNGESYGEMTMRLRRELADFCRQKDHDRGWDWGTTQKRVYDRCRKRVDDMTHEELKAAFHAATNI